MISKVHKLSCPAAFILALCCLLAHLPVLAAEKDLPFGGASGTEMFLKGGSASWEIDAGNITQKSETGEYEANGSVRIYSGDRSLQADRAWMNNQTRDVELWGNVVVRYGGNWIKGDHITWNLGTETGQVENGTIFFAENNIFVIGVLIKKTGPLTYEIEQGTLTSCDPEHPDWKLRFTKMKVDRSGVAWAKGSSLYVRKLPLLYTPWFALPFEQDRQSGLLIPWGGFSDLNGFEFELPYYWAIRQDMDATFYLRTIEKRGFMGGLEYRITNDKWGEGIWNFNYLSDQGDAQLLKNEGHALETRDRFWLRDRYDFRLPGQIEGKLDLDVVSDWNFIRDFNRGSSAYGPTNRNFREFSGRGLLDDAYSQTRESSLYLDRRWESAVATLDFRYWQQFDEATDENTFQKMPSLTFDILPSWIDRMPLYYTLESSATNYWRAEGYRGERVDVHPRVYYPLHWDNYLDVEPSVGIRGTGWHTQNGDDDLEGWKGRPLAEFGFLASSRLNRVYPIQLLDYVSFQHSIRPEISYEYVPDWQDDDIPRYDRLDMDQHRNAIRYGVVNTLSAKSIRKDSQGNEVPVYSELARLAVYQRYNLEQSFVDDFHGPMEQEEGLMPVGMRLDLLVRKYLSLSYDTSLYTTDDTPAYHDVFLTLYNSRFALRMDYEVRGDTPVNEVTATTFVKVTPNIYLSSYHDYSLDQDIIYKQGYGLRYLHGCWGVGVSYEKEGTDRRVALSLDLLGLGGIGKRNPRQFGSDLMSEQVWTGEGS